MFGVFFPVFPTITAAVKANSDLYLVQLPAGRNPLEAEADFSFFHPSLRKCAEGVTEQ